MMDTPRLPPHGHSTLKALLVLEDGAHFWGTSVGAVGETFGELVFETGMTGYQEVLTDPSYRGQIVVMTYPEIGVYGVNPEDPESSQVHVAGLVVHRAVEGPFNQRATGSFTDYLAQTQTVGIEGVDTRALTRHLRTQGAMRGAISTSDLDPNHLLGRVLESPKMHGLNLVQEVGASEITERSVIPANGDDAPGQRPDRLHIVILNAGVKEGIVRDFVNRGVRVTSAPFDAEVETIVALRPDGVLITNGPGDPAVLERTIVLIRGLLERRIPVGGICLGHQLLGLAIGARTYKMRFGHRGSNHPVKDLSSGSVIITTHNHGFAIDPTSLGIPWSPLDEAFRPTRPEVLQDEGLRRRATALDRPPTMAELLPDQPLIGESPLDFGPVEISQLSLNDGTVAGLRLLERPAFSVQHHPEASPGPHDANYFFDQFIAMVESEGTDYA